MSSEPTRRLSKRKSNRKSPTVIYVNAPTDESPATSPQSSMSMNVPQMSYAGLTPGSGVTSSSKLVRGNSGESGAWTQSSQPQTPSPLSYVSDKPLPPTRHLSPPPGAESTVQRVARGAMGGGYGPYAYHLAAGQADRSSGAFSATTATSTPYNHYRPALARPTTYTMPLQPAAWVTDELDGEDDPLHDQRSKGHWTPFSSRGCLNVGTLLILVLLLLGLFLGYPLTSTLIAHNVIRIGNNARPLGVNSTGQVPNLNLPTLIDKDTPQTALTRVGSDGHTYELVFSDEFNLDGRTFWPGDDPYWEAVDLQYWPTGNLEWLDPDAITTADGNLVITIEEKLTHKLDWQSGMMTSWNKWCFTTGYVEINVSLPGSHAAPGFWPAAWSMGNLGRAGYGATTDGTWPYSYDACDVGAVPNQMWQNNTPAANLNDNGNGGQLSTTAGQRFSACTCPGEDHPGPANNVGRGVPEIDIFEAQINPVGMIGEVSQSFQTAPFSHEYAFTNLTLADGPSLSNPDISIYNSYRGGPLQQALSAVTDVDDDVYNGTGFATYGYEWWSDPKARSEGYIQWYSQGVESWKLPAGAVGPDPISGVSQRLIPEEPMYLILNLGMSPSFEHQDFKHLVFPSSMYVDYIRVYQRQGSVNVGCNPASHPTTDYINNHLDAYLNPNLTEWSQTNLSWPANSAYDGCP